MESEMEGSTDIRHTRQMQPAPETQVRNKMSRKTLNLTYQIITGHCLLRGHLSKWQGGPSQCRRCKTANETPEHLWKDCMALYYERWTEDTLQEHTHLHETYLRFFRQRNLIKLDD